MEVKPGYKQTEVGVIPEEWDEVTVQKLVDENILAKPLDGNHGNIHPKSSDYVHYGIPFVMANNFANGEVDFESCKFITKERADKLQKGFSISGDVLLTHKGTVGNTAIVGELSTEYIMLTPQVTYYRVTDSTRLSNYYLRQYFDNQPFQSLFKSLAGGGTRAYLGIVKQLALPVVVPPLPEQRAIATALSDVDGLLGGLDRLIVKKRDLKQAAMQQLLTGSTRLPGFHGEWEVKRLDELGSCFAGGTPSTMRPDYWGGDVLWLPSGRVQNNILSAPADSEICITRKGLTESAAKSIKPHSVLVAITGATCANVALLQFEAAANQSVVAIEPFDGTNANFLYYSLLMERGQILSRQSGSAQGGVNLKTVKGLTIRCPPHPEQTAIAEVLTEIDGELAGLEQRREKTHALKQAMMQELLTGRIRLV